MLNRTRVVHWSLLIVVILSAGTMARADILHGIGVIGDGGMAAGSPTLNPTSPVVIMYNHNGLNFGGPTLPYDAASIGATSTSVIAVGNQADGIANQAALGNITLAYISIGYNDILSVRTAVATGALSGAALLSAQNTLESNVETAVNRVLTAGGKVVLGGFNDMADDPVSAGLTAPQKATLEAALAASQNKLATFAASKGIPFIDFFGLQKAIFDSGDFTVGGVHIILNSSSSSDPHYFFQSNLDAGLIIRAEVANLWMQATNEGYGTHLSLLSDQEILNLAGIGGEYNGFNTFSTPANLTLYTSTAIPEPSTAVLLAVALGGLVASRARAWHAGRR